MSSAFIKIDGKRYALPTRSEEKLDPAKRYFTDDLAKLDRVGELLAKVFLLEYEKLQKYEVLWQMYLADCKRLGIRPRQKVIVR